MLAQNKVQAGCPQATACAGYRYLAVLADVVDDGEHVVREHLARRRKRHPVVRPRRVPVLRDDLLRAAVLHPQLVQDVAFVAGARVERHHKLAKLQGRVEPRGEIRLALGLGAFAELGEHDDDAHVLLPQHADEVLECVLRRALRRNVRPVVRVEAFDVVGIVPPSS